MFFRRSELHSGLSHFSVPHSYWALTVWLSNSFILHFSAQKAMFAYAHQCKCPHQYGLSPSWCLQRHHRSCPHLCLSTEMLMQQDVILFSPAEVWAVTWPRGLMIGPFFFFFSDCSTQKLDHLHGGHGLDKGGNPVRGWWHHHYYPHRHHYDHHHHQHHHHYHHCRYWGCHPSLIFILPFPLPLLPVSISSSHSLFPPPLTFLLLLFLHPSFLYLMFLVVSLPNIQLLLHLYS